MHARFGAGPLLLIAVGLLPSCGKIANPWGGPRRYHGMREQEEDSSRLGRAARAMRQQAAP